MSTFIPSANEIERKWFVVDASGKTLGRLATQAASILAGKTNPNTRPISIWATMSWSSTRRRFA